MTVALACASPVGAAPREQITIVSYFSAPQGGFDRIRLLPHSLTSDCQIGTLIRHESTTEPMLCRDNGSGVGVWGNISNFWEIDNSSLRPSLQTPFSSLNVGLGTLSPDFRLTLDNDGGIMAYDATNLNRTILNSDLSNGTTATFFWYPRKAALRVGTPAVNETDATIGQSSVAMGMSNRASGNYSTVPSGSSNEASAEGAVIIGGIYNYSDALAKASTITGGYGNQALSEYSTVSGRGNTAGNTGTTQIVTISGGICNTASTTGVTIAGGYRHGETCIPGSITDPLECCTLPPENGGQYASIGGGAYHQAAGDYSTISGGYLGKILSGANHAVIAVAHQSTVRATENYSVIAGGQNQFTNGSASVVAGGSGHNASVSSGGASFSTILGGQSHTANSEDTVILGGSLNEVTYQDSSRTGLRSSILGGQNNKVTGKYSVIAGGTNNLIEIDHSFVFGNRLKLVSNGSGTNTNVFWFNPANSTDLTFNGSDLFLIQNAKFSIHDISPANAVMTIKDNGSPDNLFAIKQHVTGDVFLVKKNGHISIRNENPPANCVLKVGTGPAGCITTTGEILTLSSKEYKENITALDPQLALDALEQMQPVSYRYKAEPAKTHFGFIAEDVPDIVAKPDRKNINPMDVTALLTSVVREQEKQIAERKQLLEELKRQVAELEKTSWHSRSQHPHRSSHP